MAVSINMRGKAGTGGGAGGGGKSKLRRDWDALLDSPNPNTQQRFEEDFAMADPDSNMFNAKKILSNRNNLKNYANKSIPESRMNAMAAKIAAKQMKPLQDHISKTLDREITRLSRQTRPGANIGDAGLRAISERQSRITNAMATMARLTGGKYALPVVSQEVLSHAQSRIGAIQQAKQAQQAELIRKMSTPADAHVHDFRQQQAKWMTGDANSQVAAFRQQQARWMRNPADAQVAAFRQQQALWMKNPANAHILARDAAVAAGVSESARFINATGRAGQSAAFSGDRRELRKMEKNLDRISANTSKELELHKKNGTVGSVGYLQSQGVLNSVNAQRDAINRARKFSPNARKLRGGLLGDIGMGALLEGAGEFAAPVAAAGALGYAFLRSPNIMSNMASGIVSSASPYMNLRIAAANLGRAGGLNSQNLLLGIHPNGPYSPKWMSKYGIGPQKALGILSGYGIQQQYSSQSLGIVKAIARAKYLPYMGEESYGSLEKSLNLKNTLGLAGGNNAYFNKMSGVLKFAVKHGLDSASVLQTMNKSLSMAASQGAMSLSYRGLSSFQERLMGGGGSYFRSGAGVLSTEGQLNAGTNMIGRVPFPTVAAMEYARYRNGGKLPTSTGGMKKFLGVARYNQLMKNKGSAQAIRNIIAGDKGGMYQVFSANIRELLRGDPQLQAAMDRHALMQEGVPKYAWSTFAPGLGVSTTNYNQIQGTRSALNVGVSFPNKKNLFSKMLALGASRHIATDIYTGATAAGVNPYLAAVVAQHESGFKNFLNTGSGAAGPMQIMPANVKSLLANPKYRAMYNDIHGRNAKLSYLSSIILKQSLAEAHGNIKRGLEYYAVGEGNWKSNALIHTRHGTFYAKALARSDVSSEMRRLTNSSTLAENTPSRTLAAKVLAEQQKVAAGYNSFESMIINMPKYATAMALLDQNATGAAAALGRIAGNVAQGAGNLATVHPSHSPIHYVSPMEARTGVNP